MREKGSTPSRSLSVACLAGLPIGSDRYDQLNIFDEQEREKQQKNWSTGRHKNRQSRDRYRAPPSVYVRCFNAVHGSKMLRSRDVSTSVSNRMLLTSCHCRNEVRLLRWRFQDEVVEMVLSRWDPIVEMMMRVAPILRGQGCVALRHRLRGSLVSGCRSRVALTSRCQGWEIY